MMISTLRISLFLMLLAAPALWAEPGDANGDDRLDMQDVSLLNDIIQGNASAVGDADCNGDGSVTVADIVCVIAAIERGDGYLPIDPASIATPNDPTIITPFASSVSFLFSGPQAVQTGVAEGALDARYMAVMRGTVRDAAGNPLPGVVVRVQGQPDYGQTRSRADGVFDLVINAGDLLSLRFEKPGYIPVFRKISPPANDFQWLEDVVMTAFDTRVTQIDLTSDSYQVARGSRVEDSDGPRQATLLFAPQTKAEMVLPDGSTRALSSLSVRATEYTVGPDGPKAMPANLPPASAYTYCVELSVDEAVQQDAKTVRFDRDVTFYVDNFLDLPTGILVPVGYFDRERQAWIAMDNGRIIEILSTDADSGLAQVDLDGSGQAADAAALKELGIGDEERRHLGELYAAGTSVWRARTDHFTPVDLNYGQMLPPAAEPPEEPEEEEEEEEDPCEKSGSIIDVHNQSLGEVLGVSGTPYSLYYKSTRVPGHRLSNELDIQVTGTKVPDVLKRVLLEITVAGEKHSFEFPARANLRHTFTYKGLDGYGRKVQGKVSATVKIGYVYDSLLQLPAETPRSFGLFGDGNPISPDAVRNEVTLWQEQVRYVGAWDARALGLGGWSVNEHHVYDPASRTLYMGDGTIRTTSGVGRIIETVAGTGGRGIKGDGGKADEALLANPQDVEIDNRGNIYITDMENNRVRKVDTNGKITTLIGSGDEPGNSGSKDLPGDQVQLNLPWTTKWNDRGGLFVADTHNNLVRRWDDGMVRWVAGLNTKSGTGMKALNSKSLVYATQAKLNRPAGFAIDSEGNLFFADKFNHQVYRVDREGVITVVAGNPDPDGDGVNQGGFGGDGGPATKAYLNLPTCVEIDRQGNLYIADLANNRIRKVDRTGRITTIAGNGERGYTGDNGPATEARLAGPVVVRVGRTGNVYFSDAWNRKIRKISPQGIITTVAGYTGGVRDESEGAAATSVELGEINGFGLDEHENVYIACSSQNRVRKVSFLLPDQRADEIVIPDVDGETYFVFDLYGRHLRTHDALTNLVLFRFTYHADGTLASIVDVDDQATRFDFGRVANGVVVTGPYGQETVLTLDAAGFLADVRNPAGKSASMTYHDEAKLGLLATFTDYNRNTWSFTFDDLGRLTRDEDPEGGFQQLDRVERADGYTVTVTTAEGLVTDYHMEVKADGTVRRWVDGMDCDCPQVDIVNDPNGLTTIRQREGTVITKTTQSSPRWGRLVELPKQTKVTTPSGLNSVTTVSEEVTWVDPKHPVELKSQTFTLTTNGKTHTMTYDHASRKLTSVDPTSLVTTTFFDNHNAISRVERPGLLPIEYSYREDGQVSEIKQGTRIVAFGYDANGYVDSVTDPLKRTTLYRNDILGQVEQTTLADANLVAFEYDDNGNVTRVDPPGSDAFVFSYDKNNQRETETAPDQEGVVTHRFDKDLHPTHIVYPDNRILNSVYDDYGRLSRLEADGFVTTAHYDETTGQLTRITNSDGPEVGFAYDGHLPTQTTWTGEIAGSVTIDFDNDFNIEGVRIDDTAEVRAIYNAQGELTNFGSMSIGYDEETGYLGTTDLGVAETVFDYNGYGEPDLFSASVGGQIRFQQDVIYDALGRISRLTETKDGSAVVYAYTYDTRGQLTDVHRDDVLVEHYEYDDFGNRTHELNQADIASYDTGGRLASHGDWDYSFGPNGDLKGKTHRNNGAQVTYVYDLLGNLRSATLADGTEIAYVIDATNRRVGKKVNGTLVQGFLYKDSLNPVAELDGDGEIVSLFYYATRNHVPDFMIRGGKTYRIVSDFRGSPRMVIDIQSGDLVQEISYDAWGRVLADSNPGFQPFGFAGGLVDAHTGLIRFGARDYDPQVGRWTDVDPLGTEGGLNRYRYAQNDPVNFVDPDGNLPFLVILAVKAGAEAIADVVQQLLQNGGSYECIDWNQVAISAGLGALGPGLSKLAKMGWFRKLFDKGQKGCFVAGTLVATAAGLIPIEDVQVGDQVWSYRERSGEIELNEVLELHRREAKRLVELTIDGESIVTTEEHPFYVIGHGWKGAIHLEPGDRVLDRAKAAAVVDAKWVRLTDAPVYNFTVAGNHNYYVSRELVLVHNNDCTKKFKKPKKGSGKEKATDAPSWVKNHPEGKPYEGESGTDFAKRMMDAQYGEGNWTRKGDMAKQYSQIKKFGDRGFE
ncbi:Pretoxin HINT domain-containing protein [Sulfidibacter corallicola]|uniref:Dockerin domain-containing protein n=1 Tax=Sulfidibacter corallicola TaxID=2818388 RepID=A0A8A4TK32_SULCO|nr:RHS repeat-associated core domain-containing protein [Sulfidibacter corallicola]QTD50296.1 hypothetical protein J3U87_32325 [Sulfidibacter corallicola]